MQGNLEARINFTKKNNSREIFKTYPSIPDNFDYPSQILHNKINLHSPNLKKQNLPILQSCLNYSHHPKIITTNRNSPSLKYSKNGFDKKSETLKVQNRNEENYDLQHNQFEVSIKRMIILIALGFNIMIIIKN